MYEEGFFHRITQRAPEAALRRSVNIIIIWS